jgi:ABC-2 type transport system ATP-binding protein
MAMIEIEKLTKSYGGTLAVKELDLAVEAGEVLGFIGPNGAGKTTTLRMLATLLRPSGGVARVAGHDVRTAPTRVRELIGYMPDVCGVYDDMRVREYLHFFAAAYGVGHREAAATVDSVLELTDLTEKADAMADSLSRGMQQRLQLARVLLHDPEVLLLDEPASGLDPRARIEVRSLLKELRAMGKTIVVSSHILPELADLCTSIAIIEAGELLFHGGVAEALRSTQEMLGGRILVGVTERSDEARTLLASQEGVLAVNPLDGLLEVECEAGWTTERLFDLLAGAGYRLTQLADQRASLEDAFLHLTKGTLA